MFGRGFCWHWSRDGCVNGGILAGYTTVKASLEEEEGKDVKRCAEGRMSVMSIVSEHVFGCFAVVDLSCDGSLWEGHRECVS